MDIAAGNGRATNFPGVAPGASIVFVHCRARDSGGEGNLGNSKQLLDAVDYIFRKADELSLPAVVNLSISSNSGPHDGSTPVVDKHRCGRVGCWIAAETPHDFAFWLLRAVAGFKW
jgi:hypothetical protein